MFTPLSLVAGIFLKVKKSQGVEVARKNQAAKR
jgi:hypothetical protein